MNKDDKILAILETMQTDIKTMQTDITGLKQGLTRLEAAHEEHLTYTKAIHHIVNEDHETLRKHEQKFENIKAAL